jgi:hypothetical protein
LADNEAMLAIAQDGQVVATGDIMQSHQTFADTFGVLNPDGSLKSGFWVGTLVQSGNTVYPMNSQTIYNNQNVNPTMK